MSMHIPAAKQSPRVEGGTLRWYAGDTFEIVLQLELQDQDGSDVTIGESDSVTVTFYDDTHTRVHAFSFTDVEENRVTLAFDEHVSACFPQGGYTYDILYTHGSRTTLARGNRAYAE